MAITVKCQCGKRTSVADSLAGRTISCSACGRDLSIVAGGSAKSPAALKADRQKAAAGSAVSVSPGIVIGGIIGVVVFVIVLALYLGPWRVGNQWAAMSKQANNDVTDVINFSIQAYESQHGRYDPNQSHIVPHVDGDATFVQPYMAFSMPRTVFFMGATNEGAYRGTYDTTSGEIVADIEYGGMTVAGMVSIRNSTGKFHMTGREKDGKPSGECDGTPLEIVFPKVEK